MPSELQKGLSGSLEYGAAMNPARARAGPPDGSDGQRNIIGGKSGVPGRPAAFRGEGTATAVALRPLDQGRLLRAEQEGVSVVVQRTVLAAAYRTHSSLETRRPQSAGSSASGFDLPTCATSSSQGLGRASSCVRLFVSVECPCPLRAPPRRTRAS
jgi:hypothetical protein